VKIGLSNKSFLRELSLDPTPIVDILRRSIFVLAADRFLSHNLRSDTCGDFLRHGFGGSPDSYTADPASA
jgi:hypothetical protein